MLHLCHGGHGDNLGQCGWLGSLLRAGCVSNALWFVQAWMAPAADRGDTIDHGRTNYGKPSLEPLPALREENLSEYTEANLPYTATITLFKLFGDCTASWQYLSIAAKLVVVSLFRGGPIKETTVSILST